MVNDALVATSGDTYPYKAYLTMLLSYGCYAKETWLKHLEGWWTDGDGKYDAQVNIGLSSQQGMIANSHLFDFKGRLHLDMLLQQGFVPNNVNARLMLSRSRPAFHLMDFGAKPETHVHIEKATVEVRKVKVAPFKQLCLEKALSTSGAKSR